MVKSKRKVKKNGEIFTPRYIVEDILDGVEYKNDIFDKHVIDNSCGDGGFLKIVVERYIKDSQIHNKNLNEIKAGLETYIHGIESDEDNFKDCLINLNNIVTQYGINDVNWDILNQPAQNVNKYDKKMDFVVGNPPYVRVHNLEDSFSMVKEHPFCKKGMTDLFYLFYEISFKMLNKTGKLGYITPNSLYNSIAGNAFREYIQNKKNLYRIMDVGHHQPFNATTYTTILCFDNSLKFDSIDYYKYSIDGKLKFIKNIKYEDLFIKNNILLTSNNDKYKKILLYKDNKKYVEVKNGFATLKDDFFIAKKFAFNECVIDVIKGSNGEWKKCFYPYDENGKIIPISKMKSEELRNYVRKNKKSLSKRSLDKNSVYYSFGRTQAINDTYKYKIAINNTIKDIQSIKINEIKSGQGIYSGLYILTSVSVEEIKQILLTNEFIDYIASLNKCKSGGYYTFSSKDLSLYLNYKLENINEGSLIMNNKQFLEIIRISFKAYLNIGTSRSTAKLKSLHGAIANDIQKMLGPEFSIKSQGYKDDKEGSIEGRYYPKNVDITVSKNNKPVAGYAVKFVMRNYSQNNINYFENMLGETANIRSNAIPYFQIFIIFDKVPYYKNGGVFKHYDKITKHNLEKYIKLSNDNIDTYFHTPDKTLLIVVHLKEKSIDYMYRNENEYNDYYESVIEDNDLLEYSKIIEDSFGSSVIYNDYENFLKRTVYTILGKLK